MKKIFSYILTFDFLLLTFNLLAKPALAVCPVCTVAVGFGLGLSRYLGIDDTVSGVWVGGLILSTSFWFADWIHKKGVKIKIGVLTFAISALMYILTIVPLFYTGIIGHPFNTVYGLDKLLFGTVLGSIVFLLALQLDKTVRIVNGRQLFVYQKVVFPVTALVMMSLIMYFATRH